MYIFYIQPKTIFQNVGRLRSILRRLKSRRLFGEASGKILGQGPSREADLYVALPGARKQERFPVQPPPRPFECARLPSRRKASLRDRRRAGRIGQSTAAGDSRETSFDFHRPQGTRSPGPSHRSNSRLPSPPSPADALLEVAPPLFARSRSKAESVRPCPGWMHQLPKRYPRDGRGGGCN